MKTPQSFFPLTLILFYFSISSCLNKETPVPLKPKGSETTASVEMGEDYRWQVYFSLKNNTMVGKNLFTAWDLAFETNAEGWRIKLNSAKFKMVSYKTTKKDFSAVTISDTAGIASRIDMPSGSLDSTAIGDWRDGYVYILHRGTDESGKDLGMRKIQFISSGTGKYTVRFSELNGSNEKTMDIAKDNLYNFSFLSFDDGGKTLTIEPPKAEWDIVYTKYTHYYYDLDMRYSVVGCLLNSFQTTGLQDTISKSFAEIDLKSASMLKLTPFNNAIGFEWKFYDLNTGKYTVYSNQSFVIFSQQGIFYKLRFIDFYKSGVKGAPKWEYQQL